MLKENLYLKSARTAIQISLQKQVSKCACHFFHTDKLLFSFLFFKIYFDVSAVRVKRPGVCFL